MSLKQPVQYPVKYYSHLDAGAPQLADADGAIKTILKACLVTGYGTKESAGWTALFDDAFRIVLRRPLRTGNPPDIKVENGIINSVASHRIVSQDNPTGLDDAVELAAVNLLARDPTFLSEWHLVVSDFGFIFCYSMGTEGAGRTEKPKLVLYCGSTQKMIDAELDLFVTNTADTHNLNGSAPGWSQELFSTRSSFKDMRIGVSYPTFSYIDMPVSELHFNNDYAMQSFIIANKAAMPFFCSLSKSYKDRITSVISSNSRPMLRVVNRIYDDARTRVFYIPLDYWEL